MDSSWTVVVVSFLFGANRGQNTSDMTESPGCPLLSTSRASRAAQISQQIYQKQMSITEDMDAQAGSQEAVQPWVFLHPDESPPAGHLIASLFYKWMKWSELNTQSEKDWICTDLCSDATHVLSGVCLRFIWTHVCFKFLQSLFRK